MTKGGPQKLSSVHPSARIIYDAKKQFETKTSKAPLLNAKEKKTSRKYVAKFYFLAAQSIQQYFAQ